jgi:hypothetical protein
MDEIGNLQWIEKKEEIINLMRNLAASTENVLKHHRIAIAFMKKRGILHEYEEYFIDRYLSDQDQQKN